MSAAQQQKDKERLKKALDSMIFLPHLKDRQSSQSVLSALLASSSADADHAVGRPWDRSDLFRRLKTFKSSTWFAKPGPISAAECARRGWENSATDTLHCEACKAVVSCPIPSQLLPNEALKIAEKYAKQIADAHEVSCPWSSAVCALSLLQFPHIPKSAASLDFEDRFQSFKRNLMCVPPLSQRAVSVLLQSPPPYATYSVAAAHVILLGSSTTSGSSDASTSNDNVSIDIPSIATSLTSQSTPATYDQEIVFTRRLRAITLCGWTLKVLNSDSDTNAAAGMEDGRNEIGPESAMLCCGLCGAKAGLWPLFPACEPKPISITSPQAARKELLGAVATTAAATTTTTPAPLRTGTPLRSGSSAATPPPTIRPAWQFGAATPGTGGAVGGPGGPALHRHVAINVATTIAGGSIEKDQDQERRAGGGPFGGGPFGGGGGTPLFAPPPMAQTDSEPDPSGVPVFGFAALRAAEPGSVSTLLATTAAKRKRDDAWWEAALAGTAGTDTGTAGTVHQNNDINTNANGSGNAVHTEQGEEQGAAAAAAAAKQARRMPGLTAAQKKALVSKYAASTGEVKPLDPLSLHRPHCPWVNIPSLATTTTTTATDADDADAATLTAATPKSNGVCGWQWCAQQLGPDHLHTRLFSLQQQEEQQQQQQQYGATSIQGHGDGGGTEWNPAQLLRNALAKVQVKKSPPPPPPR